MVVQLESLLKTAGTSPEAQWRSRILIQSAMDADRALHLQLEKLEKKDQGPKVTALRKLQRDYGRAQQNLMQTLHLYQRQQQAEVALLTSQNDEDFFAKAMRERDAAVKQLHSSMNQVNAIYKDLADLVGEQQDHVNDLDQLTGDAKRNTHDGLKQVQARVFGMCLGEGNMDDDVEQIIEAQKHGEEGYRVGENFDWGMPFETLGKDLLSVQADVVKFGQGLWEELHGTVAEGQISGCTNGFDCQERGATEEAECHEGASQQPNATEASFVEECKDERNNKPSRETRKHRASRRKHA